MNHPTREEWMSYLYGELNATEHANRAAHLRDCPDCAAKIDGWQAARRSLDTWKLPLRRRRLATAPAVLRWAAAAVLVLSIGFGLGRIGSGTADAGRLRAAIEPEIRRELRQEFTQLLREEMAKTASATLAASSEHTRNLLADYTEAIEAKRAAENRAVYAALDTLQAQHNADFVSLKKDVDTVAVFTDAGLNRTHQQIVQLAGQARPEQF